LRRAEKQTRRRSSACFQMRRHRKRLRRFFNARIHEVESKEDREKALKETIIRIKQNSIKYRSEHLAPTDMAGLMQLVTDKRDLEELEKLHISID